jgi:hypothetical protein
MIESDKVLTISASDYLNFVGGNFSEYTPVGVQFSQASWTLGPKDVVDYFIRRVPRNAVVVVNYNVALSGVLDSANDGRLFVIATGTALVRKSGI